MRKNLLSTFILTLCALPAGAQVATVSVDELECLPVEENAAISAQVDSEIGGQRMRLFFRRLNPVGGFYHVEFLPTGGGDYWTVFPKPEDREQKTDLTDEWWEILEGADWMEGRDREWLEDFLEDQQNEASEYYAAIYDPAGEIISRSETRLVIVKPEDECEQELSPTEHGWAENLTVGETAAEQSGHEVFHWLCDGIVTRLGANGVLRPDEFCRACVVAAINPVPFQVPIILGAAITTGFTVIDGGETEVPSPVQP